MLKKRAVLMTMVAYGRSVSSTMTKIMTMTMTIAIKDIFIKLFEKVAKNGVADISYTWFTLLRKVSTSCTL